MNRKCALDIKGKQAGGVVGGLQLLLFDPTFFTD